MPTRSQSVSCQGDVEMIPDAPKERAPRNDGVHAPKVSRGDPGCALPPCCKAVLGYPVGLSPFIQVRLPKGFSFQSKESRAMSYRDAEGAAVVRGTTRTFAMAKTAVESWAWQWWDSLTKVAQNSLTAAQKNEPQESEERPLKKAKV